MKNILILTGFILINLVIRWVSIWGPPLDDDEGIYLLMGRFILEGHLPYVHYWDHQPPFIYYLSAFVQLFSQEHALAGVRILAALFTGTTAWILFCLYKILFRSFFYAILCGVVYSIWIYSPELKGWAFNNEILFNAFTSCSLLILFLYFENSEQGRKLVFFAGICMGMGFLTKQNVIFDCIPFMLLICLFMPKISFSRKNLIYYGAGCILPHSLFAILYAFYGQFFLYMFANLQSNFGYIQYESGNYDHLNYLVGRLKYYIMLIPISFLTQFSFSALKSRSLKIFFFCWLAFIIYGTTLSKTYYQHYFLQLFPCLSLLCVSVFQRFFSLKSLLSFFISPILFVVFIYSFIPLKVTAPPENDFENIAAKYINSRKQPGDKLFIFDGNVILYHLTQMPVLTRYAFPVHLIKQKYAKAFNFDQKKEMVSILDQQPSWIILEKGLKTSYRDCDSQEVNCLFYSELYKSYSLVQTLGESSFYMIQIFKRNPEREKK